MPAVTNEIQIVYGSLTCGGSSDYELTGVYTLGEDFESGYVEFQVAVARTSEATFVTACQAVEAEFRKPREDLVVTLGVTPILSRKHSNATQTALDTSPHVTKVEDGASGRSRIYSIRIDYGMPADNVSTSGRRSSQMLVESTAAKRYKLTFTGVYTATAGLTATANYLANIDTFCNARLLSFAALTPGSDVELIHEQYDPNDTNKVCEFTRVYQEVFFEQAGTAPGGTPLDRTKFVDQVFKINIEFNQPGDTPLQFNVEGIDTSGSDGSPVTRWRRLTATFSAWLDSAQSFDLDGEWTNTVLPWIVQQIRSVQGASTFVMLKHGREPTYDSNHLVGGVEGWIPSGSPVFESRVMTEDRTETGEKLVAAWTKNPNDYYKFTGPKVVTRTVVETYKSTEPFGGGGVPDMVPTAPPEGAGQTYIRTPTVTRETPLLLGGGSINATAGILIYELERTTHLQFYDEIGAEQGGVAGRGFQAGQAGGGQNSAFGPLENLPGSAGGSGGGFSSFFDQFVNTP